MSENTDTFVKLTKIGIEIRKCFVYNVFIAASNTKTAALEGGAFPKGDLNIPCTLLILFVTLFCWAIAVAARLPWLRACFT